MAADLHIHILNTSTTKEEVQYFLYPVHSAGDKRWEAAYEHIADTPNIWIGEVSWLKAALFEDRETFIPDTVGKIQKILQDMPTVLTEEVLQEIITAFSVENATNYVLANKDEVEQFLRPYVGQKVFTVSW